MRSIENKDTIEYIISDFEHYGYLLTSISIGYLGRVCPVCNGEGSDGCRDCDGDGSLDCCCCDGSGEEVCNDCGGDEKVECPECEGTGEIKDDEDSVECDVCNGSGETDCDMCDGEGEFNCSECGGSGNEDCYECDGYGYVSCYECDENGIIPMHSGIEEFNPQNEKVVAYSFNMLAPLLEEREYSFISDFNKRLLTELNLPINLLTQIDNKSIESLDQTKISNLCDGNTILVLMMHILVRLSKRINLYKDLKFNFVQPTTYNQNGKNYLLVKITVQSTDIQPDDKIFLNNSRHENNGFPYRIDSIERSMYNR